MTLGTTIRNRGSGVALTPMLSRRTTWTQIIPIYPWEPLEKERG